MEEKLMPDFDTRKPLEPNEPNRLRIPLIANRLRVLLITTKRRIHVWLLYHSGNRGQYVDLRNHFRSFLWF